MAWISMSLCKKGSFNWHIKKYEYQHEHQNKRQKTAAVLVHGFGASGTQWEKCINEIEKQTATQNKKMDGCHEAGSSSPLFDVCLAPDLIGFGHNEKPAITYTQYLWSGFINDFLKEVVGVKENIDSVVIGGNSIGGYITMAAAADDTILPSSSAQHGTKPIHSSLGAPGSGRVKGLALFNSAGRIETAEEINNKMPVDPNNNPIRPKTIAEITAMNELPPCKPPPRIVSRVFGNALLYFLRPNIVSICQKVYPTNPDATTEGPLADNILRDSLDPGAINVMISGSKLSPPRTANELLASTFGSAASYGNGHNENDNDDKSTVQESMFRGPVLVAQGFLDPLNDAKGRATLLGSLQHHKMDLEFFLSSKRDLS